MKTLCPNCKIEFSQVDIIAEANLTYCYSFEFTGLVEGQDSIYSGDAYCSSCGLDYEWDGSEWVKL